MGTIQAAFTACTPPDWLAQELKLRNRQFGPQQVRALVLFKDDLPHAPPAQGQWRLTPEQKSERISAAAALTAQLGVTPETARVEPEIITRCVEDIALVRECNFVCFNKLAGRTGHTMYAVISLCRRDVTGEEYARLMTGHPIRSLDAIEAQRGALGHELGHLEDYYHHPGPDIAPGEREFRADRRSHHSLLRHGAQAAARFLDLRALSNFLFHPLPRYQNSLALCSHRQQAYLSDHESAAMAEVIVRSRLARTSIAAAKKVNAACLAAVVNELVNPDTPAADLTTALPMDIASLRPLLHEKAFSSAGAELLAQRVYTAARRLTPDWLSHPVP